MLKTIRITYTENTMDKWDELAARAWAAIKENVQRRVDNGETLESIARLLGIKSRGAVSLWLSGGRKAENTSFPNMLRYLERLGIDYADYLPAQPKIRRAFPSSPVENVSGTGLQTVPVYTVAGAGPAVVVSELEPLFTVTAPPDYFRRSDYAIVIDGHSMEPLIPHGAIVGVKLNSPFVANELYLAQIPYEGLVVKRVGVDREKNEFVFKSINPDKEAYPDFRLSMGECENVIIGRVVWIMWGY